MNTSKAKVLNSSIEGKGTFATQDIKKGEIALVTPGQVIKNEMVDKDPYKPYCETCFQIDKGLYYCPLILDSDQFEGIFAVNHSCDPNCGISDKVNLVALKDIKEGEEITFDYAMTDADYEEMECLPTEPFECRCKSKNCRKVICGKDWMKKDLQKKYFGYFSPYIQNLISNLT